MAVLCAFVRDHANTATGKQPTDIQATLSVVVTRNTARDGSTTVVNFSQTQLAHAGLDHAHLTRALLSDANLTGANLTDAYLFGANLTGAKYGGSLHDAVTSTSLADRRGARSSSWMPPGQLRALPRRMLVPAPIADEAGRGRGCGDRDHFRCGPRRARPQRLAVSCQPV